MDGNGSGSGSGTDEVPLADPELPPPPPPRVPRENADAVSRLLARVLAMRHRPPWDPAAAAASGRADTGLSDTDVFFESAPDDDDDDDDGDGVFDPLRGGVDADDDAYAGFGFGFAFGFGAVPASGVAIACLPETTVGVGDGEARGSGECAVCLDEYEAGDAVRTMPCAHGFHERCIFGWLRLSRLCPLCRFALPPEPPEGTETDAGDVEE